MTTLPTAARADGMAPAIDPHIHSSLVRLQAACIVLALSLSACLLACRVIDPPQGWFDACHGGGPSALLFALAALGLGLLHPGAPGPAAPDRRRRTAAAIGLLLCSAALGPWIASCWALLSADGAVLSRQLLFVVPDAAPAHATLSPLSAGFAFAQGAFLLARAPPAGTGGGALQCALALGLLGITLLSLTISGLAVHFPGLDAFGDTSGVLLLAMTCLALASLGECARHPGPLSVLVSTGIGGRRVRRLLPFMVLPGGAALAMALAVGHGVASLPLAAAFAFTITTLCALFVLLQEGGRMDRLEAGLRLASLVDELTHIYNRRGFLLLGERSFQTARRQGLPLSVLYFDLDNLKPVNDAFGHATGSMLLREFAEILNRVSRASDVVARVGGDEFAVVTTTAGDALERQLQRIAAAVSERNRHGRRPYRIRYSVGQASCNPLQGAGFEELVARADARMYEQKQARRHQRGPLPLSDNPRFMLDMLERSRGGQPEGGG